MILEALAAAAVATATPEPAPAVSPLTVEPLPKTTKPPAATVEVPMDDSAGGQWASVWPADALREHISGYVVLSCDIDRYGLAEWCKVASEKPANKGFGAAAMELRSTLKLKPPQGPDGPTDQVMNIAINFKAPDPQIDWGSDRGGGPTGGGPAGSNGMSSATMLSATPLTGRPVVMLNNPVWASTVTHGDVARAYPQKAGGVEGYAVAHCEVSRQGALSGCQAIKEDPENHGFGPAALKLASRFRVAPQWTTPPGHGDLWVDVPIRFPPPGADESREVASPYWVSGFDEDQALKVFPSEAAAKGLATGYGVAQCAVTADGALTGCEPRAADPDGLGFSEAAARLAATMRMNPWQPNGAPVDGASVEVGVRLNLKPQS
jgi:TonB family protein